MFCVSFSIVSNALQLWAIAFQAPLSMGLPGKKTGVGCQTLLHGIILTNGMIFCIAGGFFTIWAIREVPK